MTKLTDAQIREVAKNNGIEYAALKAFIACETGGIGFGQKDRLIIQFEPAWFRKKAPYAPSGLWSLNKVEKQDQEWKAFNNAFGLDKNAAMQATSIGLGQIMGFNYAAIGYKSVDEMYDDAKRGEYQQLLQMVRFIISKPALFKALKTKNWHLVAYYYNGSEYEALAKKYGREPYNISMEKAYKKYSNQ